MRRTPLACWIGLVLLVMIRSHATGQGRRVESLDAHWRFTVGDPKDAMQPGFDDSAWRTVDVPHDWSIEGPFRQDSPTGPDGAFLPAGIGWYRKQFTLPNSDSARRVWVEFDGVMANSEVWINGFSLGKQPNGYIGFRYELTTHLHFGDRSPNLLSVRADNGAQPASRWYAGAGIYRHVRLIVTDPISIPAGGVVITTPQATDSQATVRIQCSAENRFPTSKSLSVRITLIDPNGHSLKTVETPAQMAAAGKALTFTQDLTVFKPDLWGLDTPSLYRAIVAVQNGTTLVDSETLPFGIRDAHFEAATGFWLNGKNIKIKGVCLHQEAGALGIAVPRTVWERRLTKLKAVGVNAIRPAHNAFSPEFMSVCDQLGLLVVDEMFDCWTVGKRPFDYHLVFKEWAERDARDTVVRDRNHPCVILYSLGNEIRDTPNAALARGILTSLRDVVRAADSTRPVTQALFRPNNSNDYGDGLADLLDVIGTNYREKELLAAHEDKPQRKILGTENTQDRRSWLTARDNPAFAGQFLWTGIDYLGETKSWPLISLDFGMFDRIMTPRPRAFERQSWWSEAPMVHIARRVAPIPLIPTDPGSKPVQSSLPTLFSDWSPSDTAPHKESVEVYSNCEQVELFLNDKSLGIQSRPADASPRLWTVPFEPGVLRAVSKNEGKEAASTTLQTAGKPARLVLTTDRSRLSTDWDEVASVMVEVTDAMGTLIPDARNDITFAVTGPAVLVGLDNGDLASHDPFQATDRHAYAGRCLAILRAVGTAGQITLSASSVGFPTEKITIQTTDRARKPAP